MMTTMPSLFFNDFDLFDDVFGGPWFNNRNLQNARKQLYGHNAKNIMSTDIKEEENQYEMIIDLPGFKKEDIRAELENGYLTICAKKGLEKDEAESEEAKDEGKYIRRERYQGEYSRSFYVGEYLKQDDIKAKFKHGLLTVIIPKRQAVQVETDKCIAIEG
ncbi:MAG: Hsp20/alpha crystallin family protein [Lachnospiraceae bacterium]|nr:Hsp20/alpha crystallin family protein [Lachnospiraceae bacterium]